MKPENSFYVQNGTHPQGFKDHHICTCRDLENIQYMPNRKLLLVVTELKPLLLLPGDKSPVLVI